MTGEHCEVDISICNTTSNACLNGGECVDGVGDNFHCKCKPGWTGQVCGTNICDTHPCQNGGICIQNINEGFKCACPFGKFSFAC